jgi:CO dehydrogenase maturation factor
VLHKNDALIMDMEAGVEHLGRATTSGVDLMLVVVEPGQRSIDCAQKIVQMAGEIGLKRIGFVGNKITSKSDEDFIRAAFPNGRILGMIPYTEQLRVADRSGRSVLTGLSGDILKKFEDILGEIERGGK